MHGQCRFQKQGPVGLQTEEPVSRLGYQARPGPLRYLAVLVSELVPYPVSERRAVISVDFVLCIVQLLTKKAETAPKFPFIRAYPPRGYETAVTRLLLQSSLYYNLELWNFA